MLFISLSSLRIKRHLWSIALGIGFTAVSCFAQPVFFTVASTPYDRQMRPVSRVLSFPAGRWGGQTSIATINQWMINLRAIPYQYCTRWQTPAEVNSAFAADCKGKAVMLYAKMRASGATHVRFVIGKHHICDLKTHAWLEWDTTSGTYLLDPTFNWTVERVEEHDPATYIAFYAYTDSRKYRASYYNSSYATAVGQN